MGERSKNMGKMLNNPKQRNIYVFGVVVVVITLVAGVYYATHTNNINTVVTPGAVVAGVPNVNNVPGNSTSPDYNKKLNEDNREDAQKALAQNGSFIPTPKGTSTSSDTSVIDLVDKQKAEEQRIKDEAEAKEFAELRRVQEEERIKLAQSQTNLIQPSGQLVSTNAVQVAVPKAVKKPKYTQEDAILINAMLGVNKAKTSSSEFNFAGQKPENNTNVATNNAVSTNDSVASNQNVNANNVVPLQKAGTMLNAILETAVNSDEPSPILAKIVTGPLKGTRLIGSIQNLGEKVVLQFSVANIPNIPSSVKISAVAVDPDSSRTAMASDVNHHYIQRYGVLLASSFLTGWAQAISQTNSISTITQNGAIITVPKGDLTAKDINRVALGNVGTTLADDAKKTNQNLKPTIKVNGGIAIGILLMDDLVVKQ